MSLFSRMDIPLCILTSKQESTFPHLLADTSFLYHLIVEILIGSGLRSIVILICIFLMVSDVGTFLHFSTLPLSHPSISFWDVSVQPLCHFFTGLLLSWLWNCSCSSSVLAINPLSYGEVACVFSRSVVTFCAGYCLPCCRDALQFNAIPLVCFCFCRLCLQGHIRNIMARCQGASCASFRKF